MNNGKNSKNLSDYFFTTHRPVLFDPSRDNKPKSRNLAIIRFTLRCEYPSCNAILG